jgi:hypothetical protein
MLNKVLENLNEWDNSYLIETSAYRKQLVSPVKFLSIHCKNSNTGYTGIVSQKRFSFYKPKGFEMPDGYFGLNEQVKRQYLLSQINDRSRNTLELILQCFEKGFVLTNWEEQIVKAFVYLDDNSKSYLYKNPNMLFSGHIRVMKYKTPQYDGHKPLINNSGTFYYGTEYCQTVKSDYDYRFNDVEIHDGVYEVIEDDEKSIISYFEEPLTIE